MPPGTDRSTLILLPRLPGGIWALGLVSMFMDISSELIHSLLPVFMVSILGASMTSVGLIEGVAEAGAAITKVFSGTISDYLGRRKLLAALGYGLSALTKPIFPLAGSIGWVFAARFLDRIGKGVRGAPRDALVADIAPPELRGAAYGLRQSLDSLGALVGPLLATLFMLWLADDIRTVLWVAAAPAFVSFAILIAGVHDPERRPAGLSARTGVTMAEARRLPREYWWIVLLGAVFYLARFSEAFLVLRIQDVGLSLGTVPLVLIVMNGVYTATAYPCGAASDRLSRKALLLAGLGTLTAANLILALAASPLPVFIGAAFWGGHMGLTQGLLAKIVADTSPADLRGTAFGIFNLVSGCALLIASMAAGVLWSLWGPPATFYAGATLAMLAAAVLLFPPSKLMKIQ